VAKVVKLRPKPQARPTRWDIYRAAAKAKLIGTVEAADADSAIKEAAKEFNVADPRKLIAVQRQTVRYAE
jgi:hypothetical protein